MGVYGVGRCWRDAGGGAGYKDRWGCTKIKERELYSMYKYPKLGVIFQLYYGSMK